MYIVSNYKVPLLVIWDLFLNDFLGGLYAFIWQASSRGDRKGERGDDMQPLAEGGIKPQVVAKDSAFSVHGVPALPS